MYISLCWRDNIPINRGLAWYKLRFILVLQGAERGEGAVINYIDAQVCISLIVMYIMYVYNICCTRVRLLYSVRCAITKHFSV